MLYVFDGIVFQVAPLNVEGFEWTTGAEVVEQAVLGAQPPLEYVGPTGEDLSFRGKAFANLFPEAVAAIERLRARAKDGRPGPLQRGDGENLGWWRLTQLREAGSGLDRQGVARLSELDMTFKRSQPPSAADYRGAA